MENILENFFMILYKTRPLPNRGVFCFTNIFIWYIKNIMAKKVIRITESELRQRIQDIIYEQKISGLIGTTTEKAWDGLRARFTTAYGYNDDELTSLTYNFNDKVLVVVSWTLNEQTPFVGTLSMRIKFNDPNIVKTNSATISKIATILGTKLNGDTILAAKPQGYLTQTINNAANLIYNGIKINGRPLSKGMAPNEGPIVDFGDYDTHQKSLNKN